MSTIVADCPRCQANRMTFDVLADVYVGNQYGWAHVFEICATCRSCHKPSILRIVLSEIALKDQFRTAGSVTGFKNDLGQFFRFDRFISIADIAARPAPPDLPDLVDAAFAEGARCLAIGCPNAASAMFRLCLDLATQELLPDPNLDGGPDKQQRRNLAPRLRWLFDQARLPADLRGLSAAVKENGDDGVHEGILEMEDAEDVFDFAHALLNRIYSEPARLAAAEKRRTDRRLQR